MTPTLNTLVNILFLILSVFCWDWDVFYCLRVSMVTRDSRCQFSSAVFLINGRPRMCPISPEFRICSPLARLLMWTDANPFPQPFPTDPHSRHCGPYSDSSKSLALQGHHVTHMHVIFSRVDWCAGQITDTCTVHVRLHTWTHIHAHSHMHTCTDTHNTYKLKKGLDRNTGIHLRKNAQNYTAIYSSKNRSVLQVWV